MNYHSDERRDLYDWAQGEFKSAKAVVVKQEIAIGDHYHNKKDEQFFLITGTLKELVVGEKKSCNVVAPYYINVPRGTYHRFVLTAGSILFGVASELFDPEDEIKL